MTLAKAFEAEPQLQAVYDSDEEVQALIDMARKLEGVTRNAGKHAGGVVISPTLITDLHRSIVIMKAYIRLLTLIKMMWNMPA